MKRWHKITLGALVAVFVLGTVGYMNRLSLFLAFVRYSSHVEAPANQPIVWDQGPAAAELPPAERPPNIIFILADDLGINDVSTFGGGIAGGALQTPNIDRLAREGAIFTQAYSGTATCAPSRAMLMTGRYPTRTGYEFTPMPAGMVPVVRSVSRQIRDDLPRGFHLEELEKTKPPFREQGLPTEEITIAEVLKERGYHTVHIGKWHMGTENGMHPNDQGFDETLLMRGGFYLPVDHPDVVNAQLDFDPIDHFIWASTNFAVSFNDSENFKPGGYLTDYWTDESLKAIEANKNRPFLLYLAHWGIHTPLQATKEDYEAVGDIQPHRLRVYAAMMRAVDRSVGRIMAKLEEEGLADNTILVFSSDNGGAGYIGLPEINAPYRGWKQTLFEGGIRVPLFMRWPAQIEPGTVRDTPVAHIDVMPTLAAAGGAQLPQGVEIDGRNLLPLASGNGEIERPNDAIFWQSGDYHVVRAGDWKLQRGGLEDQLALYDLASDPTEQANVAEDQPEKTAELLALLDAHQAGRKAPVYPGVVGGVVMIDKTMAETYEPGDEYVIWAN